MIMRKDATIKGNGEIYYKAADQVRSSRALVDSGGNVDQSRIYWPYGETKHAEGDVSDYQFSGKEEDEAGNEDGTGLYYFGARYYDPGLGRFLTIDPKAYKYPSLSPYNYCAGNPINNIDPTGKVIKITGQNTSVTYEVGMEYEGDNEKIKKIVSTLNTIAGNKKGKKVLSRLVGSEGYYNYHFGNVKKGGGVFVGNGEMKGGVAVIENASVSRLSHESFHAYQQDLGYTRATINNEVGAYLFQSMVGGSPMDFYGGNGSKGSWKYTLKAEKLWKSRTFKKELWRGTVNNFKEGSYRNRKGIYDNFNITPFSSERSISNFLKNK